MNQIPNTQTFDDFLEHYGVKGMKWGERKDPELTELDAMLADLMAVNNSNYGPFAYMLAGMDQKKKMQWLQKNFTQMSGKGKESLAKYNSVLHNVNEYMTKNKIVNRPSDPKEQKVWAEKRKKDLAASHAEFLERKQKGQNLINPNVEISARKEVRSDGSVRLSTKPRIDEIVKPKSKKGDPVIPKNPHFPMPIKHSEVVGDFLEHYGVKGMKWGKVKSSDPFTNYDLSYLSDEERKKVIDEMAKAAAGGASPKEVEKIIEAAANKSKQKAPGSITVAGKTYTAEEWKKHSKKEAARLKKERDNHWTKKVNDFAKSLGLKEDIFTTKTTYSSDEKVTVLKHSDEFTDFLEHYGVKGMKWGKKKANSEEESLGPGYLNKEDQAEYDKLFGEYKSSLNSVAPLLRSGNISGAIKALKRARVVSTGRLEVLIEKRAKNQREDSKRIDKMIKEMNSDYVLKQSDNIAGDFLEHHGDFLEHYGVMGMKWGIRKDRPNSRLPKHATFYNTDKATGATTMVDYNPRKVQVSRVAGGGIQVTGRSRKEVKRVSEEIRRQLSNKSEKKSVTSKLNLTDDELRSTINRMQLEKTYAQLTATPKQSNAMQQFMVNTGSQILGNAITNVGTEYLKQFLKVNIDKNISPEFRISKLKTEKK